MSVEHRPITFFSDGLRLDGELHLPSGIEPGERRPAVITCSGYQGLKVIHPERFARALVPDGYVCLTFEASGWLRKRTHDPGQPSEGFTVSADETDAQIELLREAYERSDPDGRKLIQLFAQLSIVDAEGNRDQVDRVVGLAQ